MKKILIAVLLLLVAAVLAGPYFIGSQIEKTSKQLVEKSNQELAKLVETNPQFQSGSLKLEDYQKGYLSTKAKSILTLSVAITGEPEEFIIPFDTDITHGPYLGSAGFGLAKIISRPDLSGFDLPDVINKDTIVMEGIVDFSQGVTETITVAPIKYTNEDDNTIDFAGAVINGRGHLQERSTFTADLNVKQLKVSNSDQPNVLTLQPFKLVMSGKGDEALQKGTYDAESGAIEASMGEAIGITLQKMAISGNYAKAKGAELMLGNAEVSFTDLLITNPEDLPMPIKLPELKFTSTVEQAENEDLSVSAKYEGTLSPSLMTLMKSPVDVKTAVFDIQFKAIPVGVVAEYQALVKNLMSESDQQAAADAMQAKTFELIQSLANNASSTHLNLKAVATEGDLVADIDTGFKPGVNFDAAQMMQLLAAPNPSDILPLLVGRGNVSLSKGVTDKAGLTPMIQMMAADFVTLKGDKFTADMKITDGQLLINGKQLPFLANQ